jgi:hypothetical protein
LNGRAIVCSHVASETPDVESSAPLQNVIDYVDHLARTMGVDFSPVLEKLSTAMTASRVPSGSTASDADTGPVLIRDAFGEMKKVLDAEQGPDGMFAVQRDPSDVLRNHRSVCEKIERLYREGNLSAVPLTEQSFQKQCLRDITECHTVWQAMNNDDITPVAEMERVLATVREKSERKLDDAVAANADQTLEATAECAAMTTVLKHLNTAQVSMNLAKYLLAKRGEHYPEFDFDQMYDLTMRAVNHPFREFAESLLKKNEDIVRASERRETLVSELKSVLHVGVVTFLKAYGEKVQERDSRRGHFRNCLLRLCVHGRSYYQHVLGRYVGELDKSHQALVRTEEDASQVNNPRRSQRGTAEKTVLLEDISDLGKRVDFANRAKEKITAIIRECGGEEQARLFHHEADGRILCLEATPANPFNPVTRFRDDEDDVTHILRQPLALEELTSHANMSEADGNEAPPTEGPRSYVEERYINEETSRGQPVADDDAEEYNIVPGGHRGPEYNSVRISQ